MEGSMAWALASLASGLTDIVSPPIAKALIRLRRLNVCMGTSWTLRINYRVESDGWLLALRSVLLIRCRHLAPLDHRRPGRNFSCPAQDMRVALRVQELGGTVGFVQHDGAIPGPYRNIRNRVIVTTDISALGQLPIQKVQLPLDLHGEAVDGIFELLRRVHVKVTEAPAHEGTRADLPE